MSRLLCTSPWALQAGAVVPAKDAQLLQLDADAAAVVTGRTWGSVTGPCGHARSSSAGS